MDEIMNFILLLFLIGVFTYFILPILPIVAIVYMIAGGIYSLLD